MTQAPSPPPQTQPELSIVVPAFNERQNLAPLVGDILQALGARPRFEILVVDDGSTDGSAAELSRLLAGEPRLRALRHTGRCGKSAALLTGVTAARAPLVATLDGDRQNDPRDLPALLQAFHAAPTGEQVGLVAGQRARRRDGWRKRASSRIANGLRRRLLRDATRDAACGFKLFPRTVFLALPQFEGMHRFLPALVRREGLAVRLVEVEDRPRAVGASKYGLWNRLWVGIGDLLAVWWLIRRRRRPESVSEIAPDAATNLPVSRTPT